VSGAPDGRIAYGQCWEDADVLLAGLQPRPGDTCLSIASAGDNTLALLCNDPARVLAVDCNPAQLACLELRVAGYARLEHPQFLELYGSSPSDRRLQLYERCRPALDTSARAFWDARTSLIERGIGHAGRFEHYLELFRRWLLPLIHTQSSIERLLQGGTAAECSAFYAGGWDNWRWRTLFQLFFSRPVMARLGRERACFDFAPRQIARTLLARARAALVRPDVAENAYLQWLLTGRHRTALPYPLRPANFATIRANLWRLEWRCERLERCLSGLDGRSIDCFNLSNVFEYLSESTVAAVLREVARVGRPGARVLYWNLFAPRARPAALAQLLRPHPSEARELRRRAATFFYRRVVLEEVLE